MFGLRKEQGRLAGMESTIEAAIHEYPTRPLFRCILANLFLELGREREARATVDSVAGSDFALLPLNNDFLLSTTLLAEVVADEGDAPKAAALYDLLLPYAAMVVDTLEMSMGAVARVMGMLAATLSRWNEAERHFGEALQINRSLGARPWVAHTEHDHARFLLARDGVGDAVQARELLRSAKATCEEIGMAALGVKVAALLGEETGAGEPVAPPLGPAHSAGRASTGRSPSRGRRSG
jgi:tetratricopeptide (TPR) repeat protein